MLYDTDGYQSRPLTVGALYRGSGKDSSVLAALEEPESCLNQVILIMKSSHICMTFRDNIFQYLNFTVTENCYLLYAT